MNPADRGWLKKHIENRSVSLNENPNKEFSFVRNNEEEYLYSISHYSGLLYGFPINLLFDYNDVKYWADKEKIKLLLVDSYINCGLFILKKDNILREQLSEVLVNVSDYYSSNLQSKSVKTKNLFGKSFDDIDIFERTLDRSVNIKLLQGNIVSSFFNNCLLFLDLIQFTRWLKEPSIGNSENTELLKFELIKLIAASANADNHINSHEKQIFNIFLSSAKLSNENNEKAKSLFSKGVSFKDINFDLLDTWLLKKYFLEISILTILANKEIDKNEEIFLEKLSFKLDLSEKELELSILAVEKFIASNWEKIYFLQNKFNFSVISNKLTAGLKRTINKNRDKIGQEISESKELVTLLAKSRKQELSNEEKVKVKEQLIDILKTIPSLALFMLPGGSLTLPLLLKILPKKILYPSSYLD